MSGPRHVIGTLQGVPYSLIWDRRQNQFPHMLGRRGGRAWCWYLRIDGVYAGEFDTKREAMARVRKEATA